VGRHQPRPRQPGEHPEPARPGGLSTFKQTKRVRVQAVRRRPAARHRQSNASSSPSNPAPSNPTPACWWPTSWPRRAATPARHRDPAEGWPHGDDEGRQKSAPRRSGSEGAQPRLTSPPPSCSRCSSTAPGPPGAGAAAQAWRRLRHHRLRRIRLQGGPAKSSAPRPARTRSSGSTSNSSRAPVSSCRPLRQGQAGTTQLLSIPDAPARAVEEKVLELLRSRYRSNHSRASRCRSNHSCASRCRSNHTTQRWAAPESAGRPRVAWCALPSVPPGGGRTDGWPDGDQLHNLYPPPSRMPAACMSLPPSG